MKIIKLKLISSGILVLTALLMGSSLVSCIDDNDKPDYSEWKETNEKYVTQQETSGDYQRLSPVWAPKLFVLMKYHTRPADFAARVRPLSTSTVDIKYRGTLIDGTEFDTSYRSVTYGDSIYRCQPCKMIDGFEAALTEMVPGDSVTVIIPAQAGYGVEGTTGIKPYSTLIFDIKMKSIYRYDSSSK